MIVKFLSICNLLNEKLFNGFDSFVSGLSIADWFIDAITDSVHLVPFLFVIFLIIELVEYFASDKIHSIVKNTEKASVLCGSLLAIIPQCGFSVIASSLYLGRYITKGTLIAIYLATSDEAIPILLADPDKIHYVLPIIAIKLVVAIVLGYCIDFVLKDKKYILNGKTLDSETGCCKHDLLKKHKSEIIIHPIKHTFSIFLFIFCVTALLNFFINVCMEYSLVHSFIYKVKFTAPIVTSVFGLIPNCAISVGLTMMLINGSLKLSAVMAGLLSNAGLGILVLLKQKNNFKDTINIILILLIVSMGVGISMQCLGL